MPAGRHRASANAPDKATVSVNERILKECHDLYIDNEKGDKYIMKYFWPAYKYLAIFGNILVSIETEV